MRCTCIFSPNKHVRVLPNLMHRVNNTAQKQHYSKQYDRYERRSQQSPGAKKILIVVGLPHYISGLSILTAFCRSSLIRDFICNFLWSGKIQLPHTVYDWTFRFQRNYTQHGHVSIKTWNKRSLLSTYFVTPGINIADCGGITSVVFERLLLTLT